MNNMKQMLHSKFTNLGGKLRLDKGNDSDSSTLPPYAESLYLSSKNDKEVCHELYRKMSTICVQNYNIAEEKKMKKNSWETLSNLLHDSEKKFSDESLTKEVMCNSINVFDEMSRNTKEFEKTLSSNVIKYFHDLSEDNALSNTKKALMSLGKDMKTNSEKVQILQDQINNQYTDISSYRKSIEISGVASVENKLASAQIIEENTEKEWDIKKDFYLTKLFASESERFTTAEKLLEFFQNHLDYYTECQKILSKFIPEIKTTLQSHKHIYAFHVSLEEHLSATNRKLSYVLETCIQELDNDETLQHEGLFRISGGRNKMELLKSALNVMRVDDFITKGCNSAVFAGVLKQYLRELPIPLMTYDLYDKWCEVGTKIRQNDTDGAMSLIKDCLSKMPSCYYDNLAYLMQFLKKISAYESVNKMSASNLGLMLGPNLIRSKQNSEDEDSEATVMKMLGSSGGSVLEFMISHFLELFPDAPVYKTVSKINTKIQDMSSNVSLSEKECEKNVKIKQAFDDDSASSGDLKLDDNISTTGAESSDNLKSDQILKVPRTPYGGRSGSFRKAPAPPPPPQIKPYSVENESDTVQELIQTRPETRPAVKKRTSILDKSPSEPTKEQETEYQSRRVAARPNVAPIIPNKKPTVTIDLPTKPEGQPPRRPNNPPPPIPTFDKLKENLDIKQPNITIRKQSYHDEVLSSSIEEQSASSTNISGKHKYSNSEGGAQTQF